MCIGAGKINVHGCMHATMLFADAVRMYKRAQLLAQVMVPGVRNLYENHISAREHEAPP